jgi:hypothetical protein
MDDAGISPLIATLLLVGITIIGGVMVYRVFLTRAGSLTKTLQVVVLNADIAVSPSTTVVSATVKNVGDVNIDSCVILVYGEGAIVTLDFGSIAPGETKGKDNIMATGPFVAGRSYVGRLTATGGVSSLSQTVTFIAS